MKRSATLWCALGAMMAASGCRSGPEQYPGTDVMGLPSFELRSASNLEKSAGMLLSGTLVYAGQGDLISTFHEYLDAMRELGWSNTYSDIRADRATAILRKNGRACHVEFLAVDDALKATIRATPARRDVD